MCMRFNKKNLYLHFNSRSERSDFRTHVWYNFEKMMFKRR